MSFFKGNKDKEKEEVKELSIKEKAEKIRESLTSFRALPEEMVVKKAIEMCEFKGIIINKDSDNNITLAKCYDILGDFQFTKGKEQKPFNSIALDVIKYYVPKSVWEDLNRIEDEDKVRELHTKLNIAEYK